VHPIAAVQSEYSLWSRDVEDEVIPACRELGITFVPYSPLGRGFLTGQFKKPEDLAPTDRRHVFPRFHKENFQKNVDLVEHIEAIAKAKNCTAGQIAIAWVLARGKDMIPIPGTKRIKYLEENIAAMNVELTPEDMQRIEKVLPPGVFSGERYHEQAMQAINK